MKFGLKPIKTFPRANSYIIPILNYQNVFIIKEFHLAPEVAILSIYVIALRGEQHVNRKIVPAAYALN